MATIDELDDAFATLDLRNELPALIESTSDYALEKLKLQLEQGQLASGEKIPIPYASKYYAKKKESLNPLPGYGVPDIKMTGNLYAGLNIKADQQNYDINSTADYVNAKSITQYGDDLLALSEDSKQDYCDNALGPAIQQYITEKTGLIFE